MVIEEKHLRKKHSKEIKDKILSQGSNVINDILNLKPRKEINEERNVTTDIILSIIDCVKRNDTKLYKKIRKAIKKVSLNGCRKRKFVIKHNNPVIRIDETTNEIIEYPNIPTAIKDIRDRIRKNIPKYTPIAAILHAIKHQKSAYGYKWDWKNRGEK